MSANRIADMVRQKAQNGSHKKDGVVEMVEKQASFKRSILYARVSRDEQGKDGKVSLDLQLDRCREYARRMGMIVVGEFKEDYTGTKPDRPEMNKVLQMFANGEADALIVMTNDRFHRKASVFYILYEQLSNYGAELHFSDIGMVDDDNAGNLVLVGVQNVMSQTERDKIVRRMTDAKHDMAKTRGVPIMSDPAYGLIKTGKHQLEKDPERARIVHQIFHWVAYGNDTDGTPISLRRVRDWLDEHNVPINPRSNGKAKRGTWNLGSLVKMIRNPIYCGHYFYGKTRLVGDKKEPVPPEQWKEIILPEGLRIVDEHTWQVANDRVDQNRIKSKRPFKVQYLLAGGHIFCGTCGRRMKASVAGYPARDAENNIVRYYRRYLCQTYRIHGLVGEHACAATNMSISCDMVEAAVVEWLRLLVENPEDIREALTRFQQAHEQQDTQPIIDRLEATRTSVEAQNQYISELMESLTRFAGNKRLKAEAEQKIIQADATREELEDQEKTILEELEQIEASSDNLKILYDLAPELSARLDNATWEDLVWLVDALAVKVTVHWNLGDPHHRYLEVKCVLSPEVFYKLRYANKGKSPFEGPMTAIELGIENYPTKMGESL